MKYIVTDNTITLFINGATTTFDSSFPKFEELSLALKNGEVEEMEINYILYREIIDKAHKLLLDTGGNLTESEKGKNI